MDLEKCKKSRATVRQSTTKLINKIEAEIKGETEMSVDIIEELLAQLSAKEETLQKVDDEIIKLSKIDYIDEEMNTIEQYKENIITWKVRAKRILNRQNKSGTRSVNTNSSSAIDSENRSVSQCTIKLPRLELCKFDGNILKFSEFWEQFKSAIHENETLNDVERFNYLKSYLSDEAEVAIRGLSLTGENYKTAVEILHERFGRKELIIDAHMSNLLNLSPVRKSFDTPALRRLYSECEIQIRGLQNLGIEPNAYSCLLYPILLKTLPSNLSLEFTRSTHQKKESKISDLLEFLKREIECRERNENLIKSSDESNIKKNVNSWKPSDKINEKYNFNVFKSKYPKPSYINKDTNIKAKIPSAAAFHTSTFHTSTINSRPECIFCNTGNDNHASENCPLNVADKKSRLIKQARCFRCLRRGHRIVNCFKKNICICGRKHHEFICDCLNSKAEVLETPCNKADQLATEPPTNNSSSNKAANVYATHCSEVDEFTNYVHLQTIRGEIIYKENILPVRILCDLGSTKSFCVRKYAEKLGLPIIAQEKIKVFSFGESAVKLENNQKVEINLRNPSNHDQKFCLEANLTDVITTAEIPLPSREMKRFCKQKGIQLSEVSERSTTNEIGLLIGSDFLWDFYTGKVQRFSENLVAVETRFGYCLSGTQQFYLKRENAIALHITTEEQSVSDNRMSEQIKLFWDLECLGIKDNATVELSKTDTQFLEEFEKGIKCENSRYEVKLPWNPNVEKLSNNFMIARRRLVNLASRFKSDRKYFEDYNTIIKDQISEGIVEVVPVSPQDEETPDKMYFMPHHGVVRDDKTTTKLRIVFDCSSQEKGFASLNSCLLPGPNLNPNLLTILLKFRTHKIAFIGDIEKAFLMVSVAKEDRDCQRFLWIEDPFKEPLKIKVLRMARVTFGVCCSPFLLAATIKHHIKGFKIDFPDAVSILDEDLYVDDFISGTEEIDDACVITKQTKDILSEASMKLRKWQTNSEELKQYWKAENFDFSNENSQESPLKVLGIKWNHKEDIFKLEMSTVLKLLKDETCTKRKVLQTTCTVYDPIGFISPFLIRMKILIQKMWQRGLKWDEELPADFQKEWRKWCEEVPKLKCLIIPRRYLPSNFEVNKENTELHIFCDASESAYGAVAYLRFPLPEEFHISFVSSKARVAPLKHLSLPRLELMGAVIAARLSNYLQQILKIAKENIFMWTDSNIVLNWIQSHSSNWKPFVSNRVGEIQSLSDPQSWNHCSGRENPADHLTRGCSAEKLLKEEKWWKGPKWLADDKISWPKFKSSPFPEEEVKQERRVVAEESIQLMCQAKVENSLFDIEKYSNVHKVLRVTAWILRFIHNIQHKNSRKSKSLSAEELSLSEKYWIKRVQEEYFAGELHALKGKRDISSTSKIYQFNPFLDDEEIIRIGGRLQNANLDFNETHPMILPSEKYFTDLLIMQAHIRVGHGGVAETLTQLRDRFWILRGRQRVKRVVNHCLTCRRFKAKPATQDMAPLPPDRINETFPFEICGVDFAGPLFIRNEGGKAYIALFTCAVTRAVHLEIVSDLTTEKFLLAFRRFISRRGICRKIYSDNARTFKRAEKDLKRLYECIEEPDVLEFFGKEGIRWQYIVERAAWWGGFWERMIRSTKSCLKRIIWKACLKFEELETVLLEVEAILNSRPLTYVYSEDKEPEPLTPGHFLIGRRLISLPNRKSGERASTSEALTRRYKYRIMLVERFWKKWKHQYLLDLRSAHNTRRSKCPSSLRADDVVFIQDSNQPRLMWKMGVVTQLHPGRDGKVRACTVKLPNGTVLKRPVQLLCPLELSSSL